MAPNHVFIIVKHAPLSEGRTTTVKYDYFWSSTIKIILKLHLVVGNRPLRSSPYSAQKVNLLPSSVGLICSTLQVNVQSLWELIKLLYC